MLNGKSHTCIHTKIILGHDLSVWSIMKNSSYLLLYFFHIFLSFCFLYFFHLFLSSSLLYFFFHPPFLWIFFRVIYYCFCTISSIHVWVRCWESFFSVLPRLSLNFLLLAVRLLVYCTGITSTLNFFLLKVKVNWNSTVKPINSIKNYNKTHK